MKRKLTGKERRAIQSTYRENPIYHSLLKTSEAFYESMSVVRYSPEDVFLESMTILDEIKCGNSAEGMFTRVYRDVSFAQKKNEEDLNLAVREVLSVVLIVLTIHDYYTEAKWAVSNELYNVEHEGTQVLVSFYEGMKDEIESLGVYVKQYMDDEQSSLSEDIIRLIDQVEEDEPIAKEKSDKDLILEYVGRCDECYVGGKREHRKLWGQIVDKSLKIKRISRGREYTLFQPVYDKGERFNRKMVLGVLGILIAREKYNQSMSHIEGLMLNGVDDIKKLDGYVRYGLKETGFSLDAIENMIEGLL